MVEQEFMTLDEVAAYFRLRRDSVKFWRYQGRGPRCTKIGKHLLYRTTDVHEWAAQQEAEQARSDA